MVPSEHSSAGVWRNLESNLKTLTSESKTVSLQALRTQQIEQLYLLPFRIVEIQKDLEYQVVLTDIPEFSLFILFSRFIHENPQIRLSKPIVHPWVTNCVIDKCPFLNDNSCLINFSQTVMEIANELFPLNIRMKTNSQSIELTQSQGQQLLHPTCSTTLPSLINTIHKPTNMLMSMALHPMKLSLTSKSDFAQTHDENHKSISSFLTSSIPFAQNSVNSNLVPTDIISYDSKNSITSVQDLDKLSNEDILLALNNQEKLEELVISCHGKQMEMFHNRRKELGKQLETLACSNLAKSKILAERKAEIKNKCAEYQAAATRLEDQTKLLEEKSSSITDVETTFDSMRVITMEAEERSDSIARSFLEGKMNTEDFLKSFQELRKLFHVRTVKCLKLNEHLCYGVPL